MKDHFISLAILSAKNEKQEALREALLQLIDPTRKEEGCIEYILFEDQATPGTFYMREAFSDKSAFDFHCQTPHFKSFASRMDLLLKEPIRLITLKRVSS